MKRNFLLAGILSILVTAGWSQQIFIKPTVGINSSDMGKDQQGWSSYSPKTGSQFGVSASLGRRFYAEPGVFYVRRNINYRFIQEAFDGPTLQGAYHFSGVQIPFTVGYHIIGGQTTRDAWGLRLFTGGSAYFLKNTDQVENLIKTQWGIFGGMGIDVAWFFLDARYEWSLTDQQKETTVFDLGRSRSLDVNLGIRIPVTK